MGVYIKGMKMPKQCYDCYLVASDPDDEDKLYCKHLDEDIIDWCSRLENCPLVEVAEPHGRLIDADVAQDRLLNIMCGTGYQSRAISAVIYECITPTVIESEE